MSLFLTFLAALPPYAMAILYIGVPMVVGLIPVWVFCSSCRAMEVDIQPRDVHVPHSVLREHW